MMFSNNRHHRVLMRNAGFGLIELLVSISIVVLVTSIVLVNQSAFNGSSLLRTQAYDVALRLREVQTSAIGAQADGTADFRSLYGVRFERDTLTRYTAFSTLSTATAGWENSVSPVGMPGVFDRRFQVTCINPNGTCLTGTEKLFVVFKRPNFDAVFYDQNGNEIAVDQVRISIGRRGATGASRDVTNERLVVVTSTGQISVQ